MLLTMPAGAEHASGGGGEGGGGEGPARSKLRRASTTTGAETTGMLRKSVALSAVTSCSLTTSAEAVPAVAFGHVIVARTTLPPLPACRIAETEEEETLRAEAMLVVLIVGARLAVSASSL